MLRFSAGAGPLQLVSIRDTSLPAPAGGNGDSVAPWVSADGRFVLFTSTASDLVTNDNGGFGTDLFLRDRQSNTTTLVSVNFTGTGGGNGNSFSGIVSTNGRYVLFESDASDLVTGDTNGVRDVFVRDLVARTTGGLSVATNGGCANGESYDAVMTPDGRYVAFVSEANNLVAEDTNLIPDVFVRDLVTRTTLVASVGAYLSNSMIAAASGVMELPSITPDGRYVAFSSYARGLADGVSNYSAGEVYVRDLVGGTTIWASKDGLATAVPLLLLVNVKCWHPALSDDGQFVAYHVTATNSRSLVLRYDALAGTTIVISTNAVSSNNIPVTLNTDDAFGPVLTPDGRYVAFVQREEFFPTVYSSVRVWDAQTGTNALASADMNGSVAVNSYSQTPAISPDGRFAVFVSNATNLVANPVLDGFHIYRRDLQGGTTRLVDVDTNGVGSEDQGPAVPGLSADGRYIAFDGVDGAFVSLDQNHGEDVFLRNMSEETNELISVRDASLVPQSGGGLSGLMPLSVSADGRWLVFSSLADDLTLNDTNNNEDVFVRDLLMGTNALVSVGTDGRSAGGGRSGNAVISADGRFVAFLSTATNLVAGRTNHYSNIFRHDLLTGSNVMVSVGADGVSPGSFDSSSPVISQDGRYVAFSSPAANLVPGVFGGAFRRDMDAGATAYLPGSFYPSGSSLAPSISSNGRYVAFGYYGSSLPQARVWDAVTLSNLYTSSSSSLMLGVTSVALSPAGNRLAFQIYQNSGWAYVVDVATGSNLYSFKSNARVRSTQWSADGRYFAVVSSTNAAPGDTNNANDIYLCDLETGTLTLVSANHEATGSANGASDSPALSGDGRLLVYRSFATDIVSATTNGSPNIFLYDRLTGSNVLLTANQQGTPGLPWASRPTISANGATIALQSWNAGLAAGDFNWMEDVFAGTVTLSVPTDTDGDGIPDWWMAQYFGHVTGQADDQSRTGDDHDQDGMSNLQEYLTGTDPVDPVSVFRLQIASTVSPTNSVLLSWLATPGKGYRIQYKNEFGDPWADSTGNAWVVGNRGYFIVSAGLSSRYFRVIAAD